MRRDDHLAGPKHPQAVGEGDNGIRVSDHAVRVDALARESGERSLQTLLGTNAGAVLVREPVPQAAVQRRADDEDLNGAPGCALHELLSEGRAVGGLVRDHQDPSHLSLPVGRP